MTRKKKTEIEELLTAERDRLQRRIETPRLAEFSGDEGDQGQAMQDATFAAGAAETFWRRLREVEAALAALHEGEYGVCTDCGEAIPERRLQAAPWALRCIACEEERERADGDEADHRAA
jgi:DnaK suppressor protein